MHDLKILKGALFIVSMSSFLGACATADQSELPTPKTVAVPANPAASRPALPKLVPTQPPAKLDVVERYSWQTVMQMGEAFNAGDAEAFLGKISRAFYRGYTTIETSTKDLFANTRSRNLVVAVQGVQTEEERVSVQAKWTCSLVLTDGTQSDISGETIFLFRKSDQALRLLDFKGDPIFGLKGI